MNANTERAINDAIDFAERNDVRIIIAGGRDAWKVRERLADENIPVILGATQAMPSGRVFPFPFGMFLRRLGSGQ